MRNDGASPVNRCTSEARIAVARCKSAFSPGPSAETTCALTGAASIARADEATGGDAAIAGGATGAVATGLPTLRRKIASNPTPGRALSLSVTANDSPPSVV